MSIWTSLEPASATVEAGGSTTVTLRLRNTGDLVEEYRMVVVGDAVAWTTVEPQAVKLYPGTTGSVALTFSPPRRPDATAGPHPYGVHITPTEQPDATKVPEGVLTITPFSEVGTELLPLTTRGRLRGRSALAVDNLGNVPVTVSLAGRDTGNRLGFDIRPSSLQIEPGRARFAAVRLRPGRILWSGRQETHPYSVVLQRATAAPVSIDGTYLQPAVLPTWVVRGLLLAGAFGVALGALWFAARPAVESRAHAATASGAQPVAVAGSPVAAGGVPIGPPTPQQAVPGAAAPTSLAPQQPAPAQPTSKQVAPAPAAPAPSAARQPAPQQPTPQPAAPQQPAPGGASGMNPGRIRNAGDNLVIDVYNGTTSDGTGLTAIEYRPANTGQGWNQPHNSTDDRYFRLENQLQPAGSVVVMDEDQSSHRVQLWSWGGGGNQEWWVDSTTTPGASYLHNRATGDCLTDNGIGQQLTAVGCRTGDPAQLWTFS